LPYRRDAFASRDTGPPALLLLDLKMPRMDGFEVLRQIKSDPAMKAISVTVFSTSHEPADLARSYELGTNAYVVKPVDFQAFSRVLREIENFWLTCNQQPPDGKSTAPTATFAQARPGSGRRSQPFEE
jgi:CheY-like chemotaxis protein